MRNPLSKIFLTHQALLFLGNYLYREIRVLAFSRLPLLNLLNIQRADRCASKPDSLPPPKDFRGVRRFSGLYVDPFNDLPQKKQMHVSLAA